MYRVRTVLTGVAGSPWYSNLHFDDQASGGAQGAIDAVADFWEAMEPFMSVDVDWRVEAEVMAVSPGTGNVENVFTETAAQGSGLNDVDILPTASQALLRFRTGAYVGGREIRGRMFVPGFTEAVSEGGNPTSGFLNSLNTAGEALRSGAGHQLLVYSRTGLIASPVTSVSGAPFWAILRSRRD